MCGDSSTYSSLTPLLVKLSQVLELAIVDSLFKALVACAPFPTTLFPVSPFSYDLLWLVLLTVLIVFWTGGSAVFPITVAAFPELDRDALYSYCMNINLLKLEMKHCNVLRCWIFDFHELFFFMSYNHQN